MLEPITLHVEELTGEEAGGEETNLTLVLDEAVLTGADINAPFYARTSPDDGIIALSSRGTGIPVDLQKLTGEQPAPAPAKLQLVVPKDLFVTDPEVDTDIGGFTNGHTIFISDGS